MSRRQLLALISAVAVTALILAVLSGQLSLADFLFVFSVPLVVFLILGIYVVVVQLGDDKRPFEKTDD